MSKKNLARKLLDKIDKLPSRPIVVIGDVMVDRWVSGRIEPCQDGCQKFVGESVVEVPGGGANARRSLQGWGGVRTELYGYAMNDCPIKTRYVADGQIVFRSDNDKAGSFRPGYGWAYALAMEMIECAGGVLLSDYDKGFLGPDFIHAIAIRCKLRGIPCVADCKRAPEVYTGCILKGNEVWNNKYFRAANVTTFGAACPNIDGLDIGLRLPEVPCVNHVGAGDCFAAHLTLGLAYGLSLKEAAAVAHSAGRVYVQRPHNTPPSVEEIVADMSNTSSE